MNEYKVDRPIHFNLSDILDSGQAFMYSEYEDGFLIITKGKRAFVKELPSENKILFRVPDAESLEIFKNYIDLSHNYEEDFKKLYELGFPEDVLSFSNGIRRTLESLNPTTSANIVWLLSGEYILHKSLSFASGPIDSIVRPTIFDTLPSF